MRGTSKSRGRMVKLGKWCRFQRRVGAATSGFLLCIRDRKKRVLCALRTLEEGKAVARLFVRRGGRALWHSAIAPRAPEHVLKDGALLPPARLPGRYTGDRPSSTRILLVPKVQL